MYYQNIIWGKMKNNQKMFFHSKLSNFNMKSDFKRKYGAYFYHLFLYVLYYQICLTCKQQQKMVWLSNLIFILNVKKL